MTRKERVINSFRHKTSDIIPYHIDFTEQEHKKMAEYLGDPQFEHKQGFHIHYAQYWGWPTPVDGRPEHFRDSFGVVWNRSGADKDIGVVDAPVIRDLDDNTYRFPPLDEVRLHTELAQLSASREDCFTMAGIGFSMFERSWSLCGMEQVLMGMLTSPEALERLYDDICEYNLRVIDIALAYQLDGFYFGDDWGQQRGLIMGPEHWRRFIKPRMKRMYERVKAAGLFVVQHSCGDIEEILPDLVEIGLDCYQTVQPEIYDMAGLKARFGGQLSFWGGISTQQLLPYATADEVRQETARLMQLMGEGGGYIAAPTHAVPFDVPPENVAAMLEVFQNQHRWF